MSMLSRDSSRPLPGLVPAGFTLVEVTLAVAMLAMVITTSITTLQRALLNLDSARSLETASRIIQCEMEKERLLSWAEVSDSSYQPTVDASFLRLPSVAGRFTLSRTIALVPNRSSQMLQITLTATWRSYDGRSLSRSCTTYYGKNGLNAYFINPV
jgi:Tfp pilus assembly protein PilV